MEKRLAGKKVAILVAEGFEQVEKASLGFAFFVTFEIGGFAAFLPHCNPPSFLSLRKEPELVKLVTGGWP